MAKCYLLGCYWYKRCLGCPVREKCKERKDVEKAGEVKDGN